MTTATETAIINALQATFEALNTIAAELPAASRNKVQEQATRIARAKATIKGDTF